LLILEIHIASFPGEVRTLIGCPKQDGVKAGSVDEARLHFPVDVCYDVFNAHSGNPRLFVADSHRILAIYYQVWQQRTFCPFFLE
jgi:hypothetical protein